MTPKYMEVDKNGSNATIVGQDVIVLIVRNPLVHRPFRSQRQIGNFVLRILMFERNLALLSSTGPTTGLLLTLLPLLLYSIHIVLEPIILNIEPLEVAHKVEVLNIVGAERQLSNNELNIFMFQLQLLEHLNEILLGDGLLPILDIVESSLQLLGVGTGHLSYTHYHLLFLVLVQQGEVLYHLPQFGHQHSIL
jgi:hypothetical protein